MNDFSANVLHINYSDNSGGAARSAYKIHSGLRDISWKSRMLVRWKVTQDSDVDDIRSQNPLVKFGDGVGRKVIDRWLNLQYLYYPSSFALMKHPWFQSADILQIYNLHGFTGFFTYRALPKISNQKPVVWISKESVLDIQQKFLDIPNIFWTIEVSCVALSETGSSWTIGHKVTLT